MKIAISVVCVVAYYLLIAALNLQVGQDIFIAIVYVFIPIIAIPFAIWVVLNYQGDRKTLKSFRSKLTANGFSVSHELNGFYVDANSRRVCFFEYPNNGNVRHWILNFTDVLGTSIVKDSETILKTSSSSLIGRAIVGGVILGGVGAIIGGVTAKSSSNTKVNKLTLEVVLNCVDHPVHRINFINQIGGVIEDSFLFKEAVKNLEFAQVLLELMMLNEHIPPASSTMDLMDTVRMLKLKVQRGSSSA